MENHFARQFDGFLRRPFERKAYSLRGDFRKESDPWECILDILDRAMAQISPDIEGNLAS